MDKKKALLPGYGGVFNPTNLNMYHYAANSPVVYKDSDGNAILVSLALYVTAVVTAPDTQFDMQMVAYDLSHGDYTDAAFGTIGLLIPGLTALHTKAGGRFLRKCGSWIVKSAKRIIPKIKKSKTVLGKVGPGVSRKHIKGVQKLANETKTTFVIHGSRQTGISHHTKKAFKKTTDLDLGVVGNGDDLMRALDGNFKKVKDVTHAPMRVFNYEWEALKEGLLVIKPRR